MTIAWQHSDSTQASGTTPRSPGACDARAVIWAGSHRLGIARGASVAAGSSRPTTQPVAASAASTASSVSAASTASTAPIEAVRQQLLAVVRAHFASDPSAREWLPNVTLHLDEISAASSSAADGRSAARGGVPNSMPRNMPRVPNAWLVFPPFHGERERFNGYCGNAMPPDEPCTCTEATSGCTDKRAPCFGKRLCAPLPRVSSRFVDAARSLAQSLSTAGALQTALGGRSVERVRVSPFYVRRPSRDRKPTSFPPLPVSLCPSLSERATLEPLARHRTTAGSAATAARATGPATRGWTPLTSAARLRCSARSRDPGRELSRKPRAGFRTAIEPRPFSTCERS